MKQFYGIKYPFTEESDTLSFLDLNETKKDSIKSMLLHIILTPKGQRLRNPEFGTNLIKYIFEPNDSETWESVKSEIRNQVSIYLPSVTFNNIIVRGDQDSTLNGIMLEIDYSVEGNGVVTDNKMLVKI